MDNKATPAEPQAGAKTLTIAPADPATPSESLPIPLSDVATKAAETAALLRTYSNKQGNIQIGDIEQSLPDATIRGNQAMVATRMVLEQKAALPALQGQQQQWQRLRFILSQWLAILTKQSNELQSAQDHLTRLQHTWSLTLDLATTSGAPAQSLQQINETLALLRVAQAPLKERLTQVLTLQSRVGDEMARSEAVLAEILRMQRTSMLHILERDSPPLWSAELWQDTLEELPALVRGAVVSYWANLGVYLENPSEAMKAHAGLLPLLLLLFLVARHQVRSWEKAGSSFSPALSIFHHPWTAALTASLLLATTPTLSPIPPMVRQILLVLLLAPIIILVRPVVSSLLFQGIVALGLVFLVDTMREILSGQHLVLGQIFLAVESLVGMVLMAWALRALRPLLGTREASPRMSVIRTGEYLVLLILAVGLVSAVIGHVRLANLLIPGIIAGGVLAMVMYAALKILFGCIVLALHLWPLRTLRMIRHHRDQQERRIHRLLTWLALTGFIIRYLNYIGLLEPILTGARTILNAKLERGSFSITPGGVLEFILTVWAAYLLSKFLRFILREDVYPRLNITPGISYAFSSLIHYFILALGTIVAMAFMGIDLSKLTVLTGAFGIGIGFGLQSIVNNFVSGLILLFERPIHVGDTVEIGDLQGNVRRIGIRASTVQTVQGADIVVPNSQLIADKVTNWTLSNHRRRIDLPVGVNYGACPETMIRLLEEVALANANILTDPAPLGLMVGYGDNAINFELRAWTNQFDDWSRIRSDLAIAVYRAVQEAGMAFPFPQREIRLIQPPVIAADLAARSYGDDTRS
jgi:small-conductance mechanosensitive channel